MRGWKRIAVVGVGVLAAAAAMAAASGKLDGEGPLVRVAEAPDAPVGGTIDLVLAVEDDAPGLGGWAASIAGQPAALTRDGDRATLQLADIPDGPQTLVVEAWDRAWRPNLTRTEVRMVVDNTPPVMRLARRSLATAQGRAHPFLVQAEEPLSALTGTFRERPVVFHRLDADGQVWRGLVGVPIEANLGTKTLALAATDIAGNPATLDVPVAVVAGRFTKGGTIRLNPAQVDARKDEEAKRQMREQRDTAYAWDQPEQLWSGPFLRPIEGGRLSSPFGRYRTYSDGKKSHHTGTDIAIQTGTPARAAAAGEVRFAGEQAIFGNVVIVHHGQGLSTSYNHLSRIDVQQGQRVAQGQEVGAVGSTGQSTGPHLHWGVVVEGVAVDGMPLLEDDLGLPTEPGWTHVTPEGQLIPVAPPD
jgi:murein DD-endopeptidase MepM/ murein hydrolase activator NlpD